MQRGIEPRRKSRALPSPDSLDVRRMALLLDVDGTLLDIATTPTSVVVPKPLRQTLRNLLALSGGAVALVSGRTIDTLDRLFAPLKVPGDWRTWRRDAVSADGPIVKCHRTDLSDALRERLHALATIDPRLLVEDKLHSIAVHYRLALAARGLPQAGDCRHRCRRHRSSRDSLRQGRDRGEAQTLQQGLGRHRADEPIRRSRDASRCSSATTRPTNWCSPSCRNCPGSASRSGGPSTGAEGVVPVTQACQVVAGGACRSCRWRAMNDFGLDLAVIGNGHTAALLEPSSRLVWWCFPRLDGDPVFSRLLAGEEEKGFCDVVLDDMVDYTSDYERNTAIVSTILTDSQNASVRITDFAPRFQNYGRIFRPPQLIRIIEPAAGLPRISVRLRPTDRLWQADRRPLARQQPHYLPRPGPRGKAHHRRSARLYRLGVVLRPHQAHSHGARPGRALARRYRQDLPRVRRPYPGLLDGVGAAPLDRL